jgi:hypothetical protein
VSKDGRVAMDLNGPYSELEIDPDGGYRKFIRFFPDDYSSGTPWGLVPLEDGGTGLIASATIRQTGTKGMYLVWREGPPGVQRDGGLRFIPQPQLDLKDYGHGDDFRQPIEVNGFWFYTSGPTGEVVVVFDPVRRKVIARVPYPKFPSARDNYVSTRLYTDGARIYMVTREENIDANRTAWWARLATEFEPFLQADAGSGDWP